MYNSKRRSRWTSVEEAIADMRKHKLFARWDDSVMEIVAVSSLVTI
jgi:hypothetical protein